MKHLRVWAEFFTPKQAMERRTIELLKKYGVNLNISTRSLSDDLAEMLRVYEKEGIEVSLWILLSQELGYFPNERTVAEYSALVDRIFNWASEKDVRVPSISVDLETPLYQGLALKNSPWFKKLPIALNILKSNMNRKKFQEATEGYAKILDKIHGFGAKTIAAAIPQVVDDVDDGRTALQDLLETPITTVEWDAVSLMLYGSMFIGYTRGFISKPDMEYMIYDYCRDARKIFDSRAAVSIGVTGVGVLGDEPRYEHPGQLRGDAEAAKAAGVDDIAIYNFEGILAYQKPEEWFEAVLRAKPRVPPATPKVVLMRKIIKRGDRLLGRVF